MSDPAEESGAQLLARLSSICRPQINNLDVNIFPNHGLIPKEIVEISGDVGLGKTTLLMHIIAKTVLPVECGGKDGQVICLLTEHNFDLEKFVDVLNKCFGECTTVATNESETDLLATSLQNLTVQRCFDETEFELAIHNLHRMLLENNRYCLIAVDNIGAFYYTKPDKSQTVYMNDVLTRLQLVISDYHLALVFTKPAYFSRKSIIKRTECVKYFLELIDRSNDETDDVDLVYKVDIPVENVTVFRKYEFDVNGCIEWK